MIDSVSRTGGHSVLQSGYGGADHRAALRVQYPVRPPGVGCRTSDLSAQDSDRSARSHEPPAHAGRHCRFSARDESEYDAFGAGHSSTSISAALGMAVAAKQQGEDRRAVAIIGDGAMTAGMAFEALNNAGTMDANLLVVLNDNDMSISPNVGALNNYLAKLMSGRFYAAARKAGEKVLSVAPPILELAKRAEEHMKGMVIPGTLFEEFGFNYIGPIDGHDLDVLVTTLNNIRQLEGPQFLHVVTQKGKGYRRPKRIPASITAWPNSILRTALKDSKPAAGTSLHPGIRRLAVRHGAQDTRLVGITPAMCEGSGMVRFSEQFPKRYFDVGIAEQHALTFAAGMACEGLKPVVAIYSTFLQRAYDQLIHDIALQNLPVVLAIDRAGLVGADGPTHAGSFDLFLPALYAQYGGDGASRRERMPPDALHGLSCTISRRRCAIRAAAARVLRSPPEMQALPVGNGEIRREGEKVAILAFGSMLAPALARGRGT